MTTTTLSPSLFSQTETAIIAFCETACLTAVKLDQAQARISDLEGETHRLMQVVDESQAREQAEREAHLRASETHALERASLVAEKERLESQIAQWEARCQALRAAAWPAAAPAIKAAPPSRGDGENLTATIMGMLANSSQRMDDIEKRVQALLSDAERADRAQTEAQAQLESTRKAVAQAQAALQQLQAERVELQTKARAVETSAAATSFECKMLTAQLQRLKEDLMASHRERVTLEGELDQAKVAMARALAPLIQSQSIVACTPAPVQRLREPCIDVLELGDAPDA